MLGYCDFQEVAIWLQTKEPATVSIKYNEITDSITPIKFTEPIFTVKNNACAATIIIKHLKPGKRYNYSVIVNDKEIELPYETTFQTQALWRWRTDPIDFRFSTGSCAYINQAEHDRPGEPYGGDYEIFEAIYRSQPDFMLWLGDNTYLREPDWNTRTGILNRYTHTRSIKELQPLLATTHHYAIWDDHDYGPNNSDRSWWNKNQTLEAFEMFWANPSYGVGDIKGAITQFQWSDVDFILLDNRWYRSPEKLIDTNKTILGSAQLQWLKDALLSSQSTFKVVALGGQFLNPTRVFENYINNGFEYERQEIIDFIYKHDLKNVVFLTGDRHHTELCVLEEDAKPRILDLTISALTSGPSTKRDSDNYLQVEGTFTKKRNYGILSFSGKTGNRIMNISTHDKDGNQIWKKSFDEESCEE